MVIWLVTISMTAAGLALILATRDLVLPPSWGFRGFTVVFAVAYGSLGALIAARRPENRIGWLLAAGGLVAAIQVLATEYANYGVLAHPGSLPGAVYAAWVASWIWLVDVFLAGPLFFMLFPNGQLKSRRWRPLLWSSLATSATMAIAVALTPGPLNNFSFVDNPFALPAFAGSDFLVGPALTLFALTFAGAALSLALRLREARGDERQQIKWVAYVAAFTALAAPLGTFGKPFEILFIVAVSSIPLAATIAILRYRLYEIDVLINRTLVYGAVTAILLAGFGIADIAAQRGLESFTGGRSDLVSGALGVGAAVAFGPLRRRVRPIVDRVLPGRAVLALLFTDIVGSTEAIVELGDDRWRALLGRYLAAVRRELAQFGGREVNTAGDAFFASFERPAGSVRCALAIRAALGRLGLETRTGLHLGEVEMRGEEVSGLAVHTAARVMAEAGPGEIFISDAMRVALAGTDLIVEDRGIHVLKGVPGAWQLYAMAAGRAPAGH